MSNSQEIIEAVKRGDALAVTTLLDQDPTLLTTRTEQGLSLVLLAAYYQEPELARLLAERCPELDIFEASAAGDLERVRQLVSAEPEAANLFASDGFQPLGLASFFGHADIVAFLLAAGAQVNSPARNSMRVMPLHSAVARQDLEITRLLLAAGADVNAVQADDFSPLHEAAQNGQLEMIKLLLSHGAHPDQKMSSGKTAYDLAVEYHHPEAADFLNH